MKKVFIVMLALITFFYAAAQTKSKVVAKPQVSKVISKNLLDSFSYAAGFNVASNMKSQGISKLNIAMMQQGIADVYKGKQPMIPVAEMSKIMEEQMEDFEEDKSKDELAKGRAFLLNNKKRKEVITLPDGLQYEILKTGDSLTIKPHLLDTVIVNYSGTLINGKEVDNSYKNGQPSVFAVNEVIKGWTEILQLMTVGDKWKIYVPTELAYNLNPRDPNLIPPGAALIYEISLEGIKPSQIK